MFRAPSRILSGIGRIPFSLCPLSINVTNFVGGSIKFSWINLIRPSVLDILWLLTDDGEMIFGHGSSLIRRRKWGVHNKKIIGYLYFITIISDRIVELWGKYRVWNKISVVFLDWNYQTFIMRISLPRRAYPSFAQVFLYYLLFFFYFHWKNGGANCSTRKKYEENYNGCLFGK